MRGVGWFACGYGLMGAVAVVSKLQWYFVVLSHYLYYTDWIEDSKCQR